MIIVIQFLQFYYFNYFLWCDSIK